MPNAETFSALVETATKCFATAFGFPPSPLSSQSRALCGIGHRLQRRERFGRNDEQRFRRIEIMRRFHEINAVHVGDETEGQTAVGCNVCSAS